MHTDDAERSHERGHHADRTAVREAGRGSQAHERPLPDGLEEEDLARVDRPPPVAFQVQEESLGHGGHLVSRTGARGK
jgi:hypothetical protein